jgi:hypothetical protein
MADSSKVYMGKGDYNTAALWLERGIEQSKDIDFTQYAPNSVGYQAFLHLYIALGAIKKNFQKDISSAMVLLDRVYQTNKKVGNELDISQKAVIDEMLHASVRVPKQYLKLLKEAIALTDLKIAYYQKENNIPYLNMTKNEKTSYITYGIQMSLDNQLLEGILYFGQQKKAILEANQQTQSSDYIYTLAAIAKYYLQQGEFSKSLEYIQKASKVSRANPNIRYSYGNMYLANTTALYYVNTSNYEVAVSQYKIGIEITERLYGPKNPNVASLKVSLARLYSDYGQFKLAAQLAKEAQQIYAQSPLIGTNHDFYFTTQTMLISNKLNEFNLLQAKQEPIPDSELFDYQLEQNCKQLIIKRQELFGKKHMNYGNALMLLAKLYTAQKNYEQALSLFQEVFEIRQNWIGPYSKEQRALAFEIARLLELTGDINAAVKAFRRSNKLTLDHLRLSFAGMTEQQRKELLPFASGNITSFYSFAHRHLDTYPELAEDVFNSNLALKGLSLETGVNIKSSILASGNDTLIANYQEWMTLRDQYIKYQQMSPATLQQKGIQLSQIDARIVLLATQLALHSSSLSTSIANAVPHSYQELKEQLKPGEVAIDFVSFKYFTGEFFEEKTLYYAAIVRPDEELPILVKIADESTLKELLQVEVSAASSNYISDKVEGEYLYQLVWQPLEMYVEDAQKIYLSPSGLLNKVAFGALLYDYYSGERLLQHYNLHYLSTMRDFFKLASDNSALAQDSSKGMLLVGGVDFGSTNPAPHIATAKPSVATKIAISATTNTDITADVTAKTATSITTKTTANSTTKTAAIKRAHAGDFQYLYGTQVEIDKISQVLQTKSARELQIQQLKAQEADEASLKKLLQQQAPAILHIASHGFFFEQGFEWNQCSACKLHQIGRYPPLFRSGIALAQANKNWAVDAPKDTVVTEDGILTAYEVSNLNLSATDLVVLSACETGRGDINNTEGVMGLQRAFKIAGCKQMILSLWKVPDEQTAELMTLFYAAYAQGIDIPVAFRQAQLAMSKRYDNPYYWAAFVLIE